MMTDTAKQLHRSYRKYMDKEGIKYPLSFRRWVRKQTAGAEWLQRKDNR